MPPMQLPYRANGFECVPPHPVPPPTWGYSLQQGPYSCYNPQVTGLRPSITWNTYAGGGGFGPGVWDLQNGFYGTPFASSSAYGADFCAPESHPPGTHGWNQTYMWQMPPQQDREESHLQQCPAAERDREDSRAPRRPRSPYRPYSRRSRVSDEKPAKATAPTTPRRSPVVTASLWHGRRTPLKKVLRSAKMISGTIFPAVRRVVGDSSDDEHVVEEEDGCYSDVDVERKSIPARSSRRTTRPRHGETRVSPSADGMRTPNPSRVLRQLTYVRSPESWERERQSHSQSQKQQPPSRVRSQRAVSTPVTQDVGQEHNALQSDMSDFEGNQQILKMNGLLDVWDARGNPNWEEETFALCDLHRCRRCGKYYAPMRTLKHGCKN
ncbi:hypothetical protein VM1G_11450 [Cytospora mali]|uniref:Uncharacterized protein n=1 Tax=Cytospora mali TaxID=578113 RepID=A0A194VP61_CYTMA|nr:hypothetical protein VM1G_11450 [Valsa mali]